MRYLPRFKSLRIARAYAVAMLAIASFACGAEPRSIADYRGDLVEIYRAGLLHHAELTGKPWDALARRLVTLTGQSMANNRLDPLIWPADSPTDDELARLSDQLLQAGCDDPSILFCCMRAFERVWRDDDAKKLAIRLADVPADKFAPAIDFALQDELCILSTTADDWKKIPGRRTQAAWNLARMTAAETRFNDSLLRLSLYLTREEDARYGDLRDEGTIMAQTSRLSGVHPWLVAILKGQSLINHAWHVRGYKMAVNVDPAAWPVFIKDLEDATKEFSTAAELKPGLPEAFAGLITTAMGAGNPVLPNFEKGFAAEIDSVAVWGSIETALLPRWGGSHEEMVQAGLKGLETDRYDTLAPYRFVDMLRMMEMDRKGMRGPVSIWDDPKLTDRALEILNKYVSAAGRSDRAARFLVVLMDQAMTCGRYAEASDAAVKLAKLPAPIRESGSAGMTPIRLSWPHAYASDQRDALEQARKLLEANDNAAAKATCQRVLDALGPDHPGRLYVEELSATADAQLKFESGQWVDLTPGQNMMGWTADRGTWRWIDGALHAASEGDAMGLYSHVRLRGPMEVIATIDLPRPTCDAQACIGLNLSGGSGEDRASIDTFLFPLFGEFRASTSAKDEIVKNGPPQTSLELRLLIEPTGITVSNGATTYQMGNAQSVASLLKIPLQPVIRQGAYYQSPRMRMIVKEFRARKLPAQN